jgi:hypothetical protein
VLLGSVGGTTSHRGPRPGDAGLLDDVVEGVAHHQDHGQPHRPHQAKEKATLGNAQTALEELAQVVGHGLVHQEHAVRDEAEPRERPDRKDAFDRP